MSQEPRAGFPEPPVKAPGASPEPTTANTTSVSSQAEPASTEDPAASVPAPTSSESELVVETKPVETKATEQPAKHLAPEPKPPEPLKPEAPTPEGVRPPAAPAMAARQALLLGGVGGIVLGFVLGYVVRGPGEASQDDDIAPDSSAEMRPNSPAAPAPQGASELVLDFGSADADSALRGRWHKGDSSQRGVARMHGPAAKIEVSLAPVAGAYVLAFVMRAENLGEAGALDVGVRLNKTDVGKFQVRGEWGMFGEVVKAGAITAGANTIEITLPRPAAEAKAPPSLEIDSLHLAPPTSKAEVLLSAVGPRGHIVSGTYGREGKGSDASAWSSGTRTRIGLLLSPVNADYAIELQGNSFGPLRPLAVEAFVNAKSIGTVNVEQGPKTTFRVPAGTFVSGVNLVEFVYPKTLKPSAHDKKSEDNRDLAIRLLGVTAAPVVNSAP